MGKSLSAVQASDSGADNAAPRASTGSKGPLIGGIASGLVASVCCIGPLVFASLGIGGAMAGVIAFLTPWREAFIGLALLFLGFAAYRLFFAPRVCASDGVCVDARTLRNQRIAFVAVTIVVAVLAAFPWYAPYLT